MPVPVFGDTGTGTCTLPEVIARARRRVVGYKAGFTNRAAQETNGLTAPACGVMFAQSMVGSGAELPAGFGARPHFEPDLIVVVKGAALAVVGPPPRPPCATGVHSPPALRHEV